MMKRFFPRLKAFVFFMYNFSGLRHIWENIIFPRDPESGKWRASTFVLWVTGIYVALFGIASQRYENRVDIIENRINTIYTQLGSPFYKRALSRIAETQRMRCPIKADIKNPYSIYQSLFYDTLYPEGVEILKSTVENWKDSLSGVNLSLAILEELDLRNANMEGATLNSAQLYRSDLHGANLKSAFMFGADLRLTNLYGANLSRSYLSRANLQEAYLVWTNLSHANLEVANLEQATFDGVKLDSTGFSQIRALQSNQLSTCFYVQHKPIALPDSIETPLQYMQWKEKYPEKSEQVMIQ